MIWLRRGPARLGRPIDSLATKPAYHASRSDAATESRSDSVAPTCVTPCRRPPVLSPTVLHRECHPSGRGCRAWSWRPVVFHPHDSGCSLRCEWCDTRTRRGNRRETADDRPIWSRVVAPPPRCRSRSRAASRMLWQNLSAATAALRAARPPRHDRDRGDRLPGARLRPDVGVAQARELRSRLAAGPPAVRVRSMRRAGSTRRPGSGSCLVTAYDVPAQFVVAEPDGRPTRSIALLAVLPARCPETVLLMPLGVRRVGRARRRSLARGAVQGRGLPLYASVPHRSCGDTRGTQQGTGMKTHRVLLYDYASTCRYLAHREIERGIAARPTPELVFGRWYSASSSRRPATACPRRSRPKAAYMVRDATLGSALRPAPSRCRASSR